MSKVFFGLIITLYTLVLSVEWITTGQLKESELFAATLGALIYHFGKFRLFKDQKEKKKQNISIVEHYKENIDDWIWSIGFVIIAIFWGKDIYLQVMGKEFVPIHASWYLLTAPLGDLVYEIGKPILPWMKRQILDRIKKAFGPK